MRLKLHFFIILLSLFSIKVIGQLENRLYNVAIAEEDKAQKIAKLDEVLKVNPQFWHAHYTLGIVYFEQKYWSKAAESFLKTLQYIPADSTLFKGELYLNTAVAYGNNKNWIEAGKNIQQACIISKNYKSYYTAGWVMEGLDDKKRALDFYKKASNLTDETPLKVTALSNCANLTKVIGTSEEAIKAYSDVLTYDMNHFAARYNRAVLYSESKQYELARQDYNMLEPLAETPELKVSVIFNRALALLELGNLEGAIADFSKVIDINASYQQAYLNRGILLNKKRNFELAEKDFEKALSLAPTNDLLRLEWIQIMSQNGKYKKALDELVSFSKKAPSNAKIWYYIGVNRSILNREENTKFDFEKAVQLDPQYAEAWLQLGNAVAREDSLDLAEKHIRKALTLKKEYWNALGNLGEIRARKGDLQGGLKDCNTALSREQSASNYISLSDVQNQIGDYYYGFTDSVDVAPRFLDSVKAARNHYTQALQSAEQAIAQDKYAGSAYFVRANCRIRLLENRAKPTSEVFEDIKKAEDLMPSNAYVRMVHALYLFRLATKEDLLNAEKLMNDVLDKKPFIQNGYTFLIQIYDALIAEGYNRKKEKEVAKAILSKRI